MDALTWVGVAVVGGLGAIARFLVDAWVGSRTGRELPFGTFVVNISGSFVLGLLEGVALHGNALIIAGTATIGSYTTFSTWMLETQRLGEEAEFTGATLNIVVSIVAGLIGIALGRAIGRAL
jgi:CrcB protein